MPGGQLGKRIVHHHCHKLFGRIRLSSRRSSLFWDCKRRICSRCSLDSLAYSVFAEVSTSSCTSSQAAEELLTANGGNTRARSSERKRRGDEVNDSKECSKVGKIQQKLSSDVVQKFEQAITIRLQFRNALICRYNFTFFSFKNWLK